MLAPPPKRKRPSSPPALGLPEQSSPLDIVKRRRRSELVDPFWNDPTYNNRYHQNEDNEQNLGETSSGQWFRHAGIERRRTRQWDRLNAPSQASLPSHNSQPTALTSFSQPKPYHQPSSPMPRCHSQPNPPSHSRAQMSSSPIRHRPPSSSPFRASGETKVEDEWMDPEEMRREWGEEYASQNSLLHNLHLARMSILPTPDTTLLSTPILPSPHHNNHHLQTGPTPYRTYSYHFPSSSPYPVGEPTESPHIRDEDESMEMDGMGGVGEEMEDEVKRRYEETNRLLRELEVVRRRRWGEGG